MVTYNLLKSYGKKSLKLFIFHSGVNVQYRGKCSSEWMLGERVPLCYDLPCLCKITREPDACCFKNVKRKECEDILSWVRYPNPLLLFSHVHVYTYFTRLIYASNIKLAPIFIRLILRRIRLLQLLLILHTWTSIFKDLATVTVSSMINYCAIPVATWNTCICNTYLHM